MVYFYLLFSQFLKLLCYKTAKRGESALFSHFLCCALKDNLAFLFLQLVVVISIIQDQRSRRERVIYLLPLELLWFPKGSFLYVTPELCLPTYHCCMSTLHF